MLSNQARRAMSAIVQVQHIFQQLANVLLVRLVILLVHVYHLLYVLHLHAMVFSIALMDNGLVVHQARHAMQEHALVQ
jgi:hypothetical protein